MEPKVTFAPGLASDVVKPSRPSRKIPTEKDYGPLAYAIILPRRAMLPRLAETDPDIIENVDLAKVWAQSNAIEASLENMCDEARKIWPNTFGCIVDPTFEDGSCYALGFADNTRPENDCKTASYDFDLQTDLPATAGWVVKGAFFIGRGQQGLVGHIHWKSDPPRAEFCPGSLVGLHLISLLMMQRGFNEDEQPDTSGVKQEEVVSILTYEKKIHTHYVLSKFSSLLTKYDLDSLLPPSTRCPVHSNSTIGGVSENLKDLG
ncbi:hypothetical protein EV359DRAFT_64699 [Lentinula novae-zelandiae]|nr:hypothetical protein EV359DRAFT_64699 [Lentinula novae-zelandiae]